MKESLITIRVQRWVAIVSVALLAVKFLAYFLTDSVAVLTDALESIANVVAGFFGLYSLILSAKPRDADHPYGHGKVEFLSAALEGSLITLSAVLILFTKGCFRSGQSVFSQMMQEKSIQSSM